MPYLDVDANIDGFRLTDIVEAVMVDQHTARSPRRENDLAVTCTTSRLAPETRIFLRIFFWTAWSLAIRFFFGHKRKDSATIRTVSTETGWRLHAMGQHLMVQYKILLGTNDKLHELGIIDDATWSENHARLMSE